MCLNIQKWKRSEWYRIIVEIKYVHIIIWNTLHGAVHVNFSFYVFFLKLQMKNVDF